MDKFALVGIQCDGLLFGGVFNTLEEAKEEIIKIVSETYEDWWNCKDPDEIEDTTLREYVESLFDGDYRMHDRSEDGMTWEIKPFTE